MLSPEPPRSRNASDGNVEIIQTAGDPQLVASPCNIFEDETDSQGTIEDLTFNVVPLSCLHATGDRTSGDQMAEIHQQPSSQGNRSNDNETSHDAEEENFARYSPYGKRITQIGNEVRKASLLLDDCKTSLEVLKSQLGTTQREQMESGHLKRKEVSWDTI
ncbi:hypothetical protein CC86DRAFT_389139 [Ophiobolus disseminans]|uniref:Uncharacterized protein n=1 Tax=Ophiobolus disseminans TaxID=1469910 RepID=A0A6A6ZBU8_9PLEO|nr:hypothetical protein CC86DRAFT_389139 [Ophiobolus disseminans]